MNISNLPPIIEQGAFDDFEASLEHRITAAISGAAPLEGAPAAASDAAPEVSAPASSYSAFPVHPATASLATLVAAAMRDPSLAADLPRQGLEIIVDQKLSAQPALNLPGAREALLNAMATDPHVLSELTSIIVDLVDRLASAAGRNLASPADPEDPPDSP
ncbi:hypothetical protein FRC98_03880 [Lujinxingia vulgaris]|uniref:Uncharacterized protein n=1 Tax=Lujinxingia vulgaris TaxID=2600176 RepID=A0A5C6XK65_9DELT|nr:hypothetical protein [Lujinxingia vulgaris]TXD38047.1 hypothetical protein FRC98_03880 [Lujinxingia vulgaris]